MNISFPYAIDVHGHTAEAEYNDHIVQMIEQVLFTEPGERVNRPDFGCGIMQLLYAANSDQVAIMTQALVQHALRQWLGELIDVEDVIVETVEQTLHISIQFLIRDNQQRQTVSFESPGVL